jgi:hypothetical protein
MTQSALQRLFLLAAGAGVTIQEFRAFAHAIREMEPHEIEISYSRFRNRIRQVQMTEVDTEFGRDVERVPSGQVVLHDIAALVRTAKLKPADAAHRIRNKLMSTPGIDPKKVVPYSVKEGFGRWVDRLARSVGASVLLNAAISTFTPERTGEQLEWRLSKP